MIDQKLAQKIILLKEKDLSFRNHLIIQNQLNDGYHEKMDKLHISNANELEKIIDSIGYPTIEKVGKEASEASWLIIQHAISLPKFMKKCLELLKKETDLNTYYIINLAYLTDRIAFFEGKLQLYGTQFDWDQNNQLNPIPYDSLEAVNIRRKRIGLNTLEEQVKIIRNQAKAENQLPPKDFYKRKQEFDNWKKQVGWIQ